MHFHIVTLFPESIRPYLESSILGRAIEKKLIKISFYDPKKFAVGKHKRVDQRPYGGGPGMILEPTAVLRATDAALQKTKNPRSSTSWIKPVVLFFATDGEVFSEGMAKKLAKVRKPKTHKSDLWVKHIILICGRYEGVDARVQKILKAKKISVGPYVLTGGELPAATVIDAIARFVPGVLGKAESLEASRVSSPEVYTRPETLTWKGKNYKVPKVLLTGHHAKINAWKNKKRQGP
ncbi:tRNA (guanosine(37)-N1)-methyltransferase TrmD [Candidatus Parcubacteria bacterium]|nr:MAG: tRNA (guanosine(37)-N1)-methyltransferase TrmD [Candidatus Parcubacteria bacterium]